MLAHYTQPLKAFSPIEPCYENLADVTFNFPRAHVTDEDKKLLSDNIISIKGNKITFNQFVMGPDKVFPLTILNKLIGQEFSVTVKYHDRMGAPTYLASKTLVLEKIKNLLDFDYRSTEIKECVVVAKRRKSIENIVRIANNLR